MVYSGTPGQSGACLRQGTVQGHWIQPLHHRLQTQKGLNCWVLQKLRHQAKFPQDATHPPSCMFGGWYLQSASRGMAGSVLDQAQRQLALEQQPWEKLHPGVSAAQQLRKCCANLDVFMNRETDSALRGPQHAKCIQDVLPRPERLCTVKMSSEGQGREFQAGEERFSMTKIKVL